MGDVAYRAATVDEGVLLAVELLLGIDRLAIEARAPVDGAQYAAVGFMLLGASSAAVAQSGATVDLFVEFARVGFTAAAAELAPRGYA